MNRSLLLGVCAVAILVIGIVRLVLGPIYVMDDGCRCGRQRRWYEFSECAALRQTRFFLKIISEGDPTHPHEYWDATWSEQFWLFPSNAYHHTNGIK